MVICIIVTIYILIRFSIWIPGKAKDFANANPRKTKYILIILALVFVGVIGLQLQKLYYEKSPYYFWNELMRKNPKPFNVSQEEFEAKNRAGYCWRDRKYYSKEELWHKAMKSLTGRMIYENKFYWDDKIVNANNQTLSTEEDCERWNGCRVFKIPKNAYKELFLEDDIKNRSDFWRGINKLIEHNEAQSFIFASDKNYNNDDFKSKNFILIHKLDSPDYFRFYDGDSCCSILNKSEWSLIRKSYTLKYTGMDAAAFMQESRIPIDININSWGVGNFYLSVTYSRLNITEFVAGVKNKRPKNPRKIFLLNNCGDILYKPYYFVPDLIR
ncbi:hypothetical protein [Snodgrassella communis]|uniref:hypothetical protein n=1 Tax=Snodgrassella communis TaxID=2946699 RepID=UPI001EF7308D|nr:hypothetical protein [Snodgrassella communis]